MPPVREKVCAILANPTTEANRRRTKDTGSRRTWEPKGKSDQALAFKKLSPV